MDLEVGKEKKSRATQRPGKRLMQTLPFFLTYTHASNIGMWV